MSDHEVLVQFLRAPDEGARHYKQVTATLATTAGLSLEDVSDQDGYGTSGSYALLATLKAPSAEAARAKVSKLLGAAATSTNTCAAARVICRVEVAGA